MSSAIDRIKREPIDSTRANLEEVFRNADAKPIDRLINHGGREVDVDTEEVYNDEYWRGFFPSDHVATFANRFVPIPAGFHKRFWTEDGVYVGETTDSDGIVTGHNRLREVEHQGRTYVLLTYTDLQYRPFYDLLLPVSDDLVVGKAFFGRFPYGINLLTFGMTRRYGFNRLAPADHAILWEQGTVPDPDAVAGQWDVQLVANARLLAPVFEFDFERTDDGIEGTYEVLDTAGGEVDIHFVEDRMEMYDFSHWHDQIRQITEDFMVGKYCQTRVQILPAPGEGSLSYLHSETGDGYDRLCVYYVMRAK